MNNDQEYKRQIKVIIDALEYFKKKQLTKDQIIKTGNFDGLSGVVIEDSAYSFLREQSIPAFPQLKGILRDDFDKLTIDDEINALLEIIKPQVHPNMPGELPELLATISNRVTEIKSSGKVLNDQNFEARFRRMVRLNKIERAVDDIVSGTEQINLKRAQEIKAMASGEEKTELELALAKKTSGGIAKDYVEYVNKSREGQNIPTIDSNKIKLTTSSHLADVVRLEKEIDEATAAILLPITIATEEDRKQFAKSVIDNPDDYLKVLSDRFPDQGEKVNEIFRDYTDKLRQLEKTNGRFPIINDDLVIEYIEPPSEIKRNIDAKPFGLNQELFNLGLLRRASIMKPEISAENRESIEDVLLQVAGPSFGYQILPIVDTTLTFGSAWTPLAATFSGKSIAESGKDGPAKAVANDLYLVKRKKKREFDELVSRLNLNYDEAKQISDQLRLLEKAFPNYVPQLSLMFMTSGNGTISEQQIVGAFNGPGNIYQNYVQQTAKGNLLQNFITNAGQSIFGKSSSNFITTKIADAAAGKAISAAFGLSLGPIGLLIAKLASGLLGGIGRFIGDNIGPISVFAGAIGGLVTFGAGGAVAGAVGGAFAAGILTGEGLFAVLSSAAYLFLGMIIAFIGVIAIPFLFAIIFLPVTIAIILFIINSGAYVVPPGPPINASNPFVAVTNDGTGNSNLSCGRSTSNGSASSAGGAIAQRASAIADNLKHGFWNDYNDSPDYPELFSSSRFQSDPNPTYPGPIQSCGDCLFWCTWLVQKSYRENGDSDLSSTLGVGTMCFDFASRGKYIAGKDATSTNIVPGSAVFFSVRGGFDHVGVVVSVNQDSIEYVQSDALTKGGSITFNSTGQGVQKIGGIVVIGFGLP